MTDFTILSLSAVFIILLISKLSTWIASNYPKILPTVIMAGMITVFVIGVFFPNMPFSLDNH